MPNIRSLFHRPGSLLLAGLMVREALSFWTGHPFDTEIWIRNAYFVSHGQNPYSSFLSPVPGLSFAYLQVELPSVGYLPIWSLLVAGLYDLYSLAPNASRFVFYFLIKQPTILADVYLGWLIFRSAERWGLSRDAATRLLRYWMFFPYAIIISAIWGQFDSIVAVLFLSFILSGRRVQRVLLLGLGMTLKWFPVIFVPFYAIRERFSRKGLTIVSLLVPAGVTLLIFTVMGWDYVGVTSMAVSVSHGGGGGLTAFNFLQSPGIVRILLGAPLLFFLLGYLWIPAIIVSGYVAHHQFPNDTPAEVNQALLLVVAVFYLTRWGVNEQYMMYLFPLFLIDTAIWHPDRRQLYGLLSFVTVCYVLVNNDLLVRFLGPINTSFVDIAYAADSSPDLGLARVIAIYALGAMFTVTCLQLAAVVLSPTRRPRPWPLLVMDRIRRRIFRPTVNSRPDP